MHQLRLWVPPLKLYQIEEDPQSATGPPPGVRRYNGSDRGNSSRRFQERQSVYQARIDYEVTRSSGVYHGFTIGYGPTPQVATGHALYVVNNRMDLIFNDVSLNCVDHFIAIMEVYKCRD